MSLFFSLCPTKLRWIFGFDADYLSYKTVLIGFYGKNVGQKDKNVGQNLGIVGQKWPKMSYKNENVGQNLRIVGQKM